MAAALKTCFLWNISWSDYLFMCEIFFQMELNTTHYTGAVLTSPLGTALPLCRTGISLLSRERFLYI